MKNVATKIDWLREQFQNARANESGKPGPAAPQPVLFENFMNFQTDFHNFDQFSQFDNFDNFQDS